MVYMEDNILSEFVPQPGSKEYSQGLANWAYGSSAPIDHEQKAFFIYLLQLHISQLPPNERILTRAIFKDTNYPSVIESQAMAFGSLTALAIIRVIPQVFSHYNLATFLAVPLAVGSWYLSKKLFRDHQWSSWLRSFKAMDIVPPDELSLKRTGQDLNRRLSKKILT